MAGQQGTSLAITVRCERCDEVTAGSVAPAFAEMTYGVPDGAGLHRSGPLRHGWWVQWIHRTSHGNGERRIRFAAKQGGLLPLTDPTATLGFGPCWSCRKPSKVRVGTLIRRAESAARASARSIYV